MEKIVIFALVFLFVAFRLWSVLGRRTGHEQQPVAKPVEGQVVAPPTLRTPAEPVGSSGIFTDTVVDPGALTGVRQVAQADNGFDPARFVEGAQGAYRMILEAYWRGDEEALAPLVDDTVLADFRAAIAERREAGHVLDNRLIVVERAVIEEARMDGQMARVTVRFDADIAAITRDAEGEVVAGSMTDAVQTHDVWTFSRHVRTADPNWVLIETDEAA
ncbi:Tim44/TimA family putative adaptor protein [Sphingomonas naphthae]|uniref:Tim44/TimA family putative adaptor protein n=1 Tax=Sphingomonas naphthae TaxID=1813468 RepID=A0ABY7TKM9_9SPHN|nr:Tim44/TimA family putative adaptor protein [Sphingomonas naphthae]WCT73331.1 Tim44/TimA family putative adaptor protein [Sphingomonas naphthae]